MKRVLLVEDNPIETKLVLRFFESFGDAEFDVESVSTLAHAIDALQNSTPDVVLLDLILEDSAGLETLLQIRKHAPDAVVVILTGLSDEGHAIEALKSGAQDYLLKADLNRQVLLRAIRYAIERKRAENERGLLQQRLLEGQKLEAIGTLARGVAHNFNNMLTAILGRSELILETADGGDNHHVIAIKRSAERAALLTRQLLTFSRKQNEELKRVDLNKVIADMRLLLESTMSSESTLEIHLCPGAVCINGDRQQLSQMLMSLVINARAAMSWNGRCTIQTAAQENELLLTVRDTGCGMSEETLAHIFEPFFSTKGMAVASGLGLSTVYGIVQQHGGSIHVTSRIGEGTEFSIRFPLVAS